MKTKELLYEWKSYLNSQVLVEIKAKDFKRDLVPQIISQEDFDNHLFNSKKGQFIYPFNDSDFLQVLYNSLLEDQTLSLIDFKSIFGKVKEKIFDPFRRGENVSVEIPGGERFSITSLDNLTYNDLKKYLELKQESNLDKVSYQQCIEQPQFNNDFEIVFEGEDWIVCYPKTQTGSIALAHSYWDGTKLAYDDTFDVSRGTGEKTGKIGWCTAADGDSNMFNNHHRKRNLHMYYCINKNPIDTSDPSRKFCISFKKEGGVVELKSDTSTVNAENGEVDEMSLRSSLGNIFDILKSDASKPERLEIDEESYYESISYKQYLVLKKANEANISNFITELSGILKYSRDSDKIMLDLLNQNNPELISVAVRNPNCPEEFLEKMCQNKNDKIRLNIAANTGCPQSIFAILAEDDVMKIRKFVAKNKSCSSEILEKLSRDSSEVVVSTVVKNPNCDERILLQLAANGPDRIKKSIASSRKISYEVSQNLVNYGSEAIRKSLAVNANCDPRILGLLASDEAEGVREFLGMNSNCPPDILSQLAQDDSQKVRWSAQTNPNYTESMQVESRLIKKYIKLILS